MPGTLLLDDLHDSISQQLGDYASSLGSAVQGAQQAIAPVPLIPTPQAPDPNAILQELQQHAAAVAQAAQEQAQPAVQVLGQGVGGAVTQLGGAKDAVTQQLLQHAQDVASGAQDVNQQLQNHVQTVLGAATPTTPSEPGGVQSLVRPTPSPVLGAPSGDQNAPPVLGATTGAVTQPATAAATTATPPDRTMSFQDYARAAAQRAGIDPNVFTAQIQQESGFNPSARSPAGAIGIAQFMPETAKGVNLDPTDPYASLDAAAAEDAKRLQQYGGDWGKTLASYNAGAGAVAQYGGIPPYAETQSYVKTIMGNAQKAADAAGTTISNAVQAGAQAVGGAASAVGTAAQQKLQDISQFGDKQLSADEAYAACGPAAAVRFAERFGRNPTLREATDLAKQVGWTSSGGMAGITSEQQLLKNMGVDTHIVAPDWLAIAKEAQTGNPVTISTAGKNGGHYYFADGYNPDTGAFHVGQSGLDLVGGAEWMTPQQMENLMGKAQGALFADNPNVPAKGATGAPTALGGAAGTQNAPITMGANQPARAPLVVEDQTPTPIRAAQDVLGAAGEAASQLGTTAQDLLAQAQELNRVQPGTEAIKAVTPILGGAAQAGGNAVSQVAQDVQNAAQGVLGAAQDVNRLTPGTTAVNAAAPVLGAAASDLGAGAQRAVQDLGDSGAANALLRQGRTPAEQAEFERQQGQVLGGIAAQANAPAPTLNAGDVARNAWDLVVNSSPGLPGVSLQDYQHASTVKNDWIEQNNPAKDVLLLGGLTTMIAQQVTDPYALTMFGFTGGAGRVAGEAAGEAATAATANRLGEQGAAFVGRVANKLVDGSIVGGVQNALYAAEQPNASPESVFTALWQGAALGSAAEGGTAALTPVARRIGQVIIDQAPRLRPAVAEFARSETGAAGRPADVAAVRDEQAGRAAPEAATPVDRMYHGTGADFPSPEGTRFDPNGLFGPGYYLTSSPEVAGGAVSRGQIGIDPATGRTSTYDRATGKFTTYMVGAGELRAPGYAQQRTNLSAADVVEVASRASDDARANRGYFGSSVAGELHDIAVRVEQGRTPASAGEQSMLAVLSRDVPNPERYVRELAPEIYSRGGNVRAVDVPKNLRLLNADTTVAPADIQRVGEAIASRTADVNDARSFVVNVRSQNPQGLTGEALQTAVRNFLDVAQPEVAATERPQAVNAVLANAGFDGITYAGGKRIPMTDAQGAPIEHQATVIFPESLPKIRNAISGRQGGQANLPFSVNVGGAVAGGVAGNVATPENATPEERARNIALGAGAGLLGTSALTRALERRRLPTEGGGGVRPPDTGFRAPVTPDDLNVRSISQAEARQLVGPAYDPSTRTTQRPPAPGEEPRRLEDVQSNPHLLREPGPGETPMTMDERLAHQDTLEQRYQANTERLAAIDEQLRNPTARPERPPWAAGFTNDQVATMAAKVGRSPYEPLWWEKAGLEAGSGEVREMVNEGGVERGRFDATRTSTPAELRAEQRALQQDQLHLEAAGEQQATAPDNARFVRRQQAAAADLPFAGGEENAPHGPYATEQPSSGAGSLAEDIVTQNGRKSYADPLTGDGLREAPGEVVGTRGAVTGTGISDIEAEGARPGAPSEATSRRMPNLDALLKGDMPEVRAQIQRAAEDNQALFDAYTQGRISHDSLVTDLATKVGMTRDQWLKTPVGKGFSTEEMVALQAAAIDAQSRSSQMAKDIVARGGVDALSPEQVAYGLNELVNNTRLLAVARGGRTSAGRTLNALKIRLDATMARGINASNERIGAQRLADQARTAVKRATQQLEQSKELNAEQRTAVTRARAQGAPRTIIDQIAEAYDQLDRYQAMTLHEKADDFNALKAAREAAAAKRQAAVREPPQELLSALQAELKAERDNFAKRKDTWETMAFWDSKANENVATKRNAFRGGLYIEQYRKAADLASKSAEADAKRAFDLESRRQTLQTQKATTLLEAVGGAKPSRELLAQYVEAVTSDDPLAAGKFVKGLMTPGWWARAQTLRIAGLLSSTVTHMANMVGNVTQVPLEVATHAAVVPIDWARAKATGGQRVAYMAELGPMLQGYGPGFASSMGDAVKILQTGISPADAVKLENIRPGIASGSGAVDAVLEGPLRALQAEDQLFKGGAFAMQANRVATRYAYREGFRGDQLAGRTANIIKNLEDYPELYSEAHAAMLRMVFQEHRDWIPAPRGAARGVVSQPLPFIKTPANITAQGMGLSPFGAAGAIQAVRARGALEATGKATGAQLDRATLLAEQRIARTAIGTAILGMGVGLGAGTFTGGKSMLTGAYDPNEASTYPQGWREWSVVTEDPVSGNTYYVPMQNFGAAGAPLAMAAILTDAGKRGNSLLDKDEAARAATSIGQYVLDNTFLQGLSDTVNVLHDPSRYANKFLESLVSSYGPFSAMGRQIQRSYGVASRNPHDGLMGLVEAMEANYPGLSGNVPESLTAIGEPRTQGISGGAAFALPVRADIMRDEPTLQVLRANDVRIPPAAKAINVGRGWSIDLTPEEQDQVQRARGDIIRQQVAAVMDSPLYKNGDISVRNQLLSKAVSAASQNSDVLFSRSLSDADIKARAVRKTVPTPYTVAGESAA